MARPTATVVVPFLGFELELRALLARLRGLRLNPGDEVVVADNRPDASPEWRDGVAVVVPARSRRAPAHARNVAAGRARGEWLVFLDADCTPAPGLLDAYLDPAPRHDVAILAGAIEDRAERDTAVARYVSARRKMDQRHTLAHPHAPYAQTASCAIRREALAAAGGFADGVRMGDDADLCWRLLQAGWRLEERPRAVVAHRSRHRARDLLAQMTRHGMGLAWLERCHPGAAPGPGPRALAGRTGRYLLAAARAPTREARLHALLDLATLCARDAGRLRDNDAPLAQR